MASKIKNKTRVGAGGNEQKKAKGKRSKKKKGGGGLIYDGEIVSNLDREEIERITYKVRDEVTQVRSERIRYQLERDFLYDLLSSTMNLYKIERDKTLAKTAENNRAVQDKEDAKIIKAIEAKHFRYETQIKSSEMDVQKELRRKMILENLEKYWRAVTIEIEEMSNENEKMLKSHVKNERRLTNEMDDLDLHEEEVKKQLVQFKNLVDEKMKESIEAMNTVEETFKIKEEDRANDRLYKVSKIFEQNFTELKNYYNDVINNMLNLILNLREQKNHILKNNKEMKGEVSNLNRETMKYKKELENTEGAYKKAKIRKNQIERLKDSISKLEKEMESAKEKLDKLLSVYRNLINEVAQLEEQRDKITNFQFK